MTIINWFQYVLVFNLYRRMKKIQYIFIRINWLYITILYNTKTKILALSYTLVESYTPRIIKIENAMSSRLPGRFPHFAPYWMCVWLTRLTSTRLFCPSCYAVWRCYGGLLSPRDGSLLTSSVFCLRFTYFFFKCLTIDQNPSAFLLFDYFSIEMVF